MLTMRVDLVTEPIECTLRWKNMETGMFSVSGVEL